MSEFGPNVIDAIARFSEQSAPNVLVGDLDTTIMRQALHEQPELFIKHIAGCDVRVVDKLYPELDEGIETALVRVAAQEDDDLSQEQFGVFYVLRKGTKIPRLIVPTSVIDRAYNWIGPLYASTDVDNDVRVEAAVAMTAWMGLGGWVFDKIDPRQRPDYREYSKAHIRLARLAHITPDELDDDQSREEKISDTMMILRWRFMGSLAYSGLMQGIENKASSDFGITRDKLSQFRVLYTAMFAENAQKEPESITPHYFALAYPLSGVEKEEAIRLLVKD